MTQRYLDAPCPAGPTHLTNGLVCARCGARPRPLQAPVTPPPGPPRRSSVDIAREIAGLTMELHDAINSEAAVMWLVVFQRDADPADVVPFTDEVEARCFYNTATLNWSEVYLCRVVAGPGDVMRAAAEGRS